VEHPAFPADLLGQRGRCFLDPDEVDAEQGGSLLDDTAQLEPSAAARRGRLHREINVGSRTVVTSVKGALGESGVSGAASCAAAFLCGRAGWVPPIAGLEAPDPAAAGLNLASAPVAAPGPIVLVNSFASGGALFSVVLRVAS